jgi:hypothetical protein
MSMHLDLNPLQPAVPGGLGVTDAWRDPLGLMLASTGEGVFGVDLEGLCVFINPAVPA